MNRSFIKFLIGTKLQTFVASLYNFGFLLLFYKITNSVLLSSYLTVSTIICKTLLMFFIVPHCKGRNPLKISIQMNFSIAIVALAAILVYPLLKASVWFYFILSILFSVLEEIDNSYQYPVIPSIVNKEYLFKANSLNAIMDNTISILAPAFAFIFYNVYDLRVFLLIYGLICIGSCTILMNIEFDYKPKMIEKADKTHKKVGYFKEWRKTFSMIKDCRNIMFCIAVGVCINLIFAGLNGPILLKMGSIASNKVFGMTTIKVALSAGSIIGISAVYKLKVRENYSRFLTISMLGLIVSLQGMAFASSSIVIYISFFLLSIFIMFIMNATGTFLQLITPNNELPAIYAFRQTLYSFVIPISFLVAGFALEYFNRVFYFEFSAVLILILLVVKIRVTGTTPVLFSVEEN